MTNRTGTPEPAGAVAGVAPEPAGAVVALDGAAFSHDGRTIALSGVTTRIHPGEAHALIGPNAAGKSTLIKGLLGLIPLVEGRVEVLGTTPRLAARRSGYMPQTDEIDPEFPITLRQVVMMGRYRGIGPFRFPGRADRAAVAAAIARVGLDEHADRHFGSLSGGQQQRAILARAIVSKPPLLLLDEPFNGLDQPNREMVLALLRELRGEGVAVIVTTHDFEIATAACSHVMLLNGHQVAAGPVESTMTTELLDETFGHVSADDEAHGHYHVGHGHYHDTGFRGTRDQHGSVEDHLAEGADLDDREPWATA